MKNDLTCGVVRDLLPSYVEGLTSGETNAAVERHLAGCPDCTARRDAMAAPAEPAETADRAARPAIFAPGWYAAILAVNAWVAI